MKHLKLTILLDNSVSKADLANTFGDYVEINLTYKYLQWSFPSIRMLTYPKLHAIHDLISTYERENGELKFKMFHLLDDATSSHSPHSIQCLRGMWSVNSSDGTQINVSQNLLTLI